MGSIQKTLTVLIAAFSLLMLPMSVHAQVTNPQTGSIGLEGTIPTEPPSTGASITFPRNGQTFRELPIRVVGICPADLLVKIFKNEVFAGSTQCTPQGNFELQIDLFSGANDLVARVYDSLDQPGPDSNTVTVNYISGDEPSGVDELIISSNYALRGSNAGTELKWPLALAGGVGPYAVSVDWGDGETTQFPLERTGNFTIEHTYFEPGVYRVTIRATDSRDKSAFLQVVALANGPAGQEAATTGGESTGTFGRLIIPMWPIYIMFFFIVSTFWLGRRYELRRIKNAVRTGKAVRL